jgi:prenyltransferase beta subunit
MRPSSSKAVLVLTVAMSLVVPERMTAAPPRQASTTQAGRKLLTPQAEQAVSRGLMFLAGRQKPDGSIGKGRSFGRNVGVTSLCGMAFLAAGHTPGRGKYGRNVDKAIEFVLSRCQPSGFITDPQSRSHGPMYGHGFATLFLAQVYGMSQEKELREKLQKAVALIVKTQNKDGGWRYYPVPKEADISVTVCQMIALRAARNCGLHVPKETVDRCVDYVKRCQNPDGGFRYRLQMVDSGFPRSAAAVTALYGAGLYDSPETDLGIVYLMRHIPDSHSFGRGNYFFYGHYYAAQAMWQKGGEDWLTWYPAIRDELLRRERLIPTGGWIDRSKCNEYATAMACLILQTPNNYLPIFHR